MPVIERKGSQSSQGFGEFAKTGAAVYIEDVFQTWLYTGNGSTQTITNGINLSTNGGLVWIKGRNGTAADHLLYDTSRGVTNGLVTNTTDQTFTNANTLTAFNTNGFTVGSYAYVNGFGATPTFPDSFVSWTFRKQPKFFDVVTYTGNGATTQTINHSLGAVPGCIIAKGTSNLTDWPVYHRSLNGGTTPEQWYLRLNATSAQSNAVTNWGNVAPTSTTFTVGANNNVNGYSYVAYLFAHDAGGFGAAGTDNVITCGSYTGNGSNAGPTINLGYEPQWLLYKNASNAANWGVIDNMRGWATSTFYTAGDQVLRPNTSGAEFADDLFSITSTGFQVVGTDPTNNYNGQIYIYIAIRRGPMKTPTSGTSVFNALTTTGNGSAVRSYSGVGFPPDTVIPIMRTSPGNHMWGDRLRGSPKLDSTSTAAEDPGYVQSYDQDGWTTASDAFGNNNTYTFVDYLFRRAPGFFDVVCYTGTGSATTFSHNLGVAPELMIVKRRDSAGTRWCVYSAATTSANILFVDTNAGSVSSSNWNNTAPTASVFSVGTSAAVNASGGTYVAYLFATVAGVSKVGSYTGTGALQTINCGFTGGARFVLLKRTDSTGDWFVYDSARGISSGNDPYLLMNSTAAEVTGTNYVDTASTGFQVTAAAPADLNANGGSYIFLAIA